MQLRHQQGLFNRQTVTITPQVIQSIKLLQLGNAELEEYLLEQAEKNPFLEVVAATPGHTGEEQHEPDARQVSERIAPPIPGSGSGSGERAWLRAGPAGSGAGETWQGPESYCASRPTLQDLLLAEVPLAFTADADRAIAVGIIHSLEDDGYLRRHLEELVRSHGTDLASVTAVLHRIQQFAPAGVAARTLCECLALQLEEGDRLDASMRALLDNLPLLAKGDVARLAQRCGVDTGAVGDMIRLIRTLDPRPGLKFDTDPALPAVPDVEVTEMVPGKRRVGLNSNALPRVLVDREYYAEITASPLGGEDKRFVVDCMQNARWLARNLDKRAQTVLKVAAEIVQRQRDFLDHGEGHLRPMSLKEVATAVELHESTVCRAIANKFMMTPRGMFELRYFFSNAVAAIDEGDGHSSERVRHLIGSLIGGETPDRVLSDAEIVTRLRRDGVDIARRTVAKYRGILRIPSSQERRRRMKVAALV